MPYVKVVVYFQYDRKVAGGILQQYILPNIADGSKLNE